MPKKSALAPVAISPVAKKAPKLTKPSRAEAQAAVENGAVGKVLIDVTD